MFRFYNDVSCFVCEHLFVSKLFGSDDLYIGHFCVQGLNMCNASLDT